VQSVAGFVKIHRIRTFSRTRVWALYKGFLNEWKGGNMAGYEKVREILEQQKREILSGVERTLQTGVEKGVELFPDPADLASVEEIQGFSYRLKEREKKLLRKIDEALERIEEGSFGICERCGEAIEEKRMLARPVTTYCIACKTILEEAERAEQIRR
jgi:DnaK suppressor protein